MSIDLTAGQFWHELCTNPSRRSALVKALYMRKLKGLTDNPCERSGHHRTRPTVTVREQEPIALPGPATEDGGE